MREALAHTRPLQYDSGISTPSTARTARQAVLRHAAASHASLSGLAEHRSSSTSASAVLSELEAHLSDARTKTTRWRGVTDSRGWRQTAFGQRSTPDWVHTHVLREEVKTLEHEAVHGVAAKALNETTRVRAEAAEQRKRAHAAEGELQQQLAEVTHAQWRSKEELTACERRLRGREEEVCSDALRTGIPRGAALGSGEEPPPSSAAPYASTHDASCPRP